MLLGKTRPKIMWADVEAVKAELQSQLEELLGRECEQNLREPEKKKKQVKVRDLGMSCLTGIKAPFSFAPLGLLNERSLPAAHG